MTPWLLSIVGITVCGVLIELLLTDSPMSKFIRAIYSFFILFVIIQPIPAFFKMASNSLTNAEIPLNAALIQDLNEKTTHATAEHIETQLRLAGFDTIVTVTSDAIFVNAANSTKTDESEIIHIVTTLTRQTPDKIHVFI